MTTERVELKPRTPTPEMIAAAWAIVDKERRGSGITKLMPGLGVREIWEAMYDAAALAEQAADFQPKPTLSGGEVGGPTVEEELEHLNGQIHTLLISNDHYRDVLRTINRRASPRPDRTLGECADELPLIADLARAALTSIATSEQRAGGEG